MFEVINSGAMLPLPFGRPVGIAVGAEANRRRLRSRTRKVGIPRAAIFRPGMGASRCGRKVLEACAAAEHNAAIAAAFMQSQPNRPRIYRRHDQSLRACPGLMN